MFKTDSQWEAVSDRFSYDARTAKFSLRSDGHARLYLVPEDAAEIFVGAVNCGETRIEVQGKAPLRFSIITDDETLVWIRFPEIDQTALKTTDQTFTTLDRPEPLSAEMLAIQRLMRRNELDREEQRRDMERIIDARLHPPVARKDKRAAPEDTSTDASGNVGKKSGGGKADAAKQSGKPKGDAIPELDALPDGETKSRPAGSKGDEDVQSDGDTDGGGS